jgi:hypothetical protein
MQQLREPPHTDMSHAGVTGKLRTMRNQNEDTDLDMVPLEAKQKADAMIGGCNM